MSFLRWLPMSRFASLFSSALFVVALAFAFLGAVMPSPAHAQSSVSGVTCSTLNGTYVCTQNGSGGTACVTSTSSGSVQCENYTTGSDSSGSSMGTGLGSTIQQPSGSASSGWLSKLTWWIGAAIVNFFDALVSFLKDLVTYVCSVVLALVAAAINAIGSPAWLSQYSMQSSLSPVMGTLGYWLQLFDIPQAFAIIGLGYVFRLLRKFLTLFQW